MNKFSKIIVGIAGGLVALVGLGWAGLQVAPQNFPPSRDESQDLGMVAVPAELPVPVRRYFQVAFGNRIPRVESMVAWGRARANFGIWTPLLTAKV